MFLLVYYAVVESVTGGRSVGKYVTKTKAINQYGQRLDIGTVLKRTLCRIIPFDPLSFLGSVPRGWHDSLSDTYVVDIEKFEAAIKKKNDLEEIGVESI